MYERTVDGKIISSLIEKTIALDGDVMLIEDGEHTSKITKKNLLKEVNSQLDKIESEIDIEGIKVHFPQRNLNKADCIVIETNESITVIDVGWEKSSSNLVKYLKSKGIYKVDNFIITHYHDDHIGGETGQGVISFISSDLDFSNCVCYLPHKDMDYDKLVDNVGRGMADKLRLAHESVINGLNDKSISFKYANEDEVLKLSKVSTLKMMNISSEYLDEYYNETLSNNDVEQGYTCYNNFSIVCELIHLKKKFLFSGDIEVKAQEMIFNKLQSNYDVYKVEHHGVNRSTYKDYLYKINPSIAVVQNRSTLGLRDKMTTTYLYNKGCKIYDTNSAGDIVITSNGIDVYVDALTESKIDIGFNYVEQPCDLRKGISIKEGDDLNNYTNLGVFYSETSSITSSLKNKPANMSSGGFRLIVQARQTDSSPIQTIIDASANIFIRVSSSSGFGGWKQVINDPGSYINCGISASYTTTSTTSERLSLNTVTSSRGNGLKLQDGCVVVGSGVTAVKVTGQVGWSSNASGTNALEGYIYKNNTSIARNGITSISTYFGVPLVSKIIDVQEGDKISLGARSRTKEGFTVSNANDSTWLCVESV